MLKIIFSFLIVLFLFTSSPSYSQIPASIANGDDDKALVMRGIEKYDIMEESYQSDADNKRIHDIHKLAFLIEKYKKKTGHYPLADFDLGGSIGKVAYGRRLVVYITPYSLEELNDLIPIRRPGFKYQELKSELGTLLISDPKDHAFLSHETLLDRLKSALGGKTRLPFDPQKIPHGRPNFYMYYLDNNADTYIVSAAISKPYKTAVKVAPGYYKYEIGNNYLAGNHVIEIYDIPMDTLKEARILGERAEKKFAKHTWVESE